MEYVPLETAWVPITGDNCVYMYCLWVSGACKGKGYGRTLMEYCLADAEGRGKSGVCMLGAQKQKAWLSDQSFAKRFGFEAVDMTASGYKLLALSFDGTTPQFAPNAKKKLPCVFNNWAVFYKGEFETVNLLDVAYLERILKK